MRKKILNTGAYLCALLVIFAGLSSFRLTQVPGDEINGIWMTQSRESMVQVYRTGNKYYGKLYWLKYPNDPETGKPKTDKHNPDPKLRSRGIMGLVLVKDFTYDPHEKEWGGGTIYDPKSGNTYNCKAKLDDQNTLEVRGYIGYSWMGLGRTEIWKKIMN